MEMKVRELIKKIKYCGKVVEIYSFKGKNIVSIKNLEKFYDCEVQGYDYHTRGFSFNPLNNDDFGDFYRLKIFI